MRCTVLPNDFDPVLASSSRFIPQAAFVIYKGLLAVFFISWCIRWPLSDFASIYLFVTYWAFYTGALYFFVSFVTACHRWLEGSAKPQTSEYQVSPACEDDVPMPHESTCWSSLETRLLCVQIVTWNISCMGSLVVSTIFWTSLYDGGSLTSVDINAHIFFSIIMLIDQMLVASQFRVRDLWVVEVFAAIYLSFNIAWYFTAPNGSKLIYSFLDWSLMPGEAAAYSAVVMLILIPFFACVHFIIFRFREFLYAGCQRRVASPPASLSDHLLSVDGGGNQQGTATLTAVQTGTRYVDV